MAMNMIDTTTVADDALQLLTSLSNTMIMGAHCQSGRAGAALPQVGRELAELESFRVILLKQIIAWSRSNPMILAALITDQSRSDDYRASAAFTLPFVTTKAPLLDLAIEPYLNGDSSGAKMIRLAFVIGLLQSGNKQYANKFWHDPCAEIRAQFNFSTEPQA